MVSTSSSKAVALATSTAKAVAAVSTPAALAATGLDKAFKAKGRAFIGTASDSNRFSNPTDSQVTIREFGSVTPENSMKWDAVSPFSLGMVEISAARKCS